MYAKLFTSLYQGTLRGNSNGILVFTNLIAHADQVGVVDKHPRAIAEETGITLDAVRAALLQLEAPDEESRSPEEDGRRIVRVDDHRAWGWRVVNYAKYRSIRNEDDRREQNRLAQQRWRERHGKSAASNQDKPHKPPSAHTEAEAEASLSTLPGARAQRKAEALPDCPHQELLALWAEVLPAMPQHVASQWKGARAAHLRARWRETAAEKKWADTGQGMLFFRKLFGFVGQSRFLTGRAAQRSPGQRPFVVELDWLVKPTNWAKVIEGKYHTESA